MSLECSIQGLYLSGNAGSDRWLLTLLDVDIALRTNQINDPGTDKRAIIRQALLG